MKCSHYYALWSPNDFVRIVAAPGRQRRRLRGHPRSGLCRPGAEHAGTPRGGGKTQMNPSERRSQTCSQSRIPAAIGLVALALLYPSQVAIVGWTEPTFSGGYSLSGSLLGDSLGSMTLVVNGNRVVGSVETGGQMYRVRSAGGGLSSIIEVEEPPFRCGVDDLSPETDHGH